LDDIKNDASIIFLLGDIFDFWFEYKKVVPKGFVRLLGKLAELSDLGKTIYYFTGNHDMWVYDYFPKEFNIKIFKSPIELFVNNKRFFIGHGDGLGPKDYGYKFIKRFFSNNMCQWLFARLHPNFGIWLARFFSKRSRIANGYTDEVFLGEEKEYLIQYANEVLQKEHYDYFIFGHRHLPLDIKLNEKATYINLGDWIKSFSYAIFDGNNVDLRYYKKNKRSAE
ncbi:UDP-2,3-diacylglucosamine diphosphatase, partial [candidate division KSB1 bacterium]